MAGTTSLYNYPDQRPAIYKRPVKVPACFARDLFERKQQQRWPLGPPVGRGRDAARARVGAGRHGEWNPDRRWDIHHFGVKAIDDSAPAQVVNRSFPLVIH